MQLLHEEFHYLDVRDQLTFKLLVHQCLNGRAPQYIAVHCVPLSNQRHFRSAERNLLHVPRHRLNTYGRLALATAGPSARNSLPDPFRNPNSTEAAFYAAAIDIFSHGTGAHSTFRGFYRWCVIQIDTRTFDINITTIYGLCLIDRLMTRWPTTLK